MSRHRSERMDSSMRNTYPDVCDGFQKIAAEQDDDPVIQDSFLTVLQKKEQKFLEGYILDDDLMKVFFTASKDRMEWIDKDGVLNELKKDFKNVEDLKDLCFEESLLPPNEAESYAHAIAKYYHSQTQKMFHYLKEMPKLLPVINGLQLGVSDDDGTLWYCDGHDGKVKSKVEAKDAFEEVDKITWLLNNEIDSLPEKFVENLGNIVLKIAAARLLNCILLPLNVCSVHARGDFVPNVHHRQLLFSFTILYRLCKHGRRVEKSVVQVGRFTDDSKKMKLYMESIRAFLNDERIKCHPVVVISGYGAPRCGKSFFLNLMIKWCEEFAKSEGKTDHFTLDSEVEVTGFKSDSDEYPVTKGLWMWREPLIISNGQKKVAILIMDTEGVGHSEQDGNSLIIPFICMHMSAICINNVRTCPTKDDLLFHITSQFLEKEHQQVSAKPFGHLIMLYRDSHPKKGFHSGLADERSKMYEIWKTTEIAFIEAQRFYLCHPGECVDNSVVKIKEIKEDFMDLCHTLFDELFGLQGKAYNYTCSSTDLSKRIEGLEEMIENLPVIPTMDELCKESLRSKLINKYFEIFKISAARDIEIRSNDTRRRLAKDTENYGPEFETKTCSGYDKKLEQDNDTKGFREYHIKFAANNMVTDTEEETKHTKKEIDLKTSLKQTEELLKTPPTLPGSDDGVTKHAHPSLTNRACNLPTRGQTEPKETDDENDF